VVGLRAFVALNDIEEDFVALFEVFVAVLLYGAEVDKDVGAVFTADEPITFEVVEPLYGAFVSSERVHGKEPFPLEESENGGSHEEQDGHFVGVWPRESGIRRGLVRKETIFSRRRLTFST
jgi:hypothetical protein